MKLYKIILAFAVGLMMLTGCDAYSDYDAKLCDRLSEKISRNEELTQQDYSDMIEQLGYMDDEFHKMTDKLGDDPEAYKKLMSDERVASMLGYTATFSYALAFTDDLDEANTKAYEKLQQRFEERDSD